MTPIVFLVTVLASYLVGAIPFGYLVACAHGVDIFKVGSGNIGATNVGRVLGKRAGILVFVFDFLKGALPVLGAAILGQLVSLELPADALRVAAGLAAFLGHLFPVYLRFRGGKGVATGAGVVAVLVPLPLLGALLIWLTVAGASRCVSLASIASVIALCVLRLLFPDPFAVEHVTLTLFCFLASLLVVVRHRANLRRLLAGTENRLPENRAMNLVTRTLHVLALGLWFGSSVFFSFVVGPTLFDTYWTVAQSEQRPGWFPIGEGYSRNPEEWKAREPAGKPLFADASQVRREQGTRAAGAAVGPLFPWYYLIEGICGLVALITALAWSRGASGGRVHAWRAWLLVLALATVLAGWPLERYVASLGEQRNLLVDMVLTTPQPATSQLEAAREGYNTFVAWHLVSLFLNFGTVLLVTGAMALAANLPTRTSSAVRSEEAKPEPLPAP